MKTAVNYAIINYKDIKSKIIQEVIFMELRRSHRAISFLLSLIMLLALSSVFCFERAYAASDGEWIYEYEGGGVTITGYIGNERALTVPAKLGNEKVVKVESLSDNNTKNRVTSITFANGINVIGDALCKGYSALERVTLPDTLTTIGNDAFASCSELKAITVPASVTSIGNFAFGDCTSLVSANLSCRATVIPARLFAGDYKLNSVTLPTYATEIGELAFGDCTSLTTLTLPDTVKSIGKSAFNNCTVLKNINVPRDVELIDELAFQGCKSIETLFIPNKIRTINAEAFSGCSSLKTVYISPSLALLRKNIFNHCTALESIIFGGDYFGFSDLSNGSISATLYYPENYAKNWADYSYSKKKSYQLPKNITVSGDTKVKVGSKTDLKLSITPSNSDFGTIYQLTFSDPTIAYQMADGKIFARSTGVTDITITTVGGYSKTVTFSVKPDAPTGLKAEAKSITSATISWKPVYNVTGYYVYRSTSKTGTYKKVGSTFETSFTDKGLTKGKTYYYKVASYTVTNGKEIISSNSSAVSVKAAAPAPSSLTAKKSKAGAAKITWSKSTGASGYEVYMATSKNGKYSKITTISKASTLSYTKSGLTKNKTYYFKVRSYTTVSGKKIYSDYTSAVKVKV